MNEREVYSEMELDYYNAIVLFSIENGLHMLSWEEKVKEYWKQILN